MSRLESYAIISARMSNIGCANGLGCCFGYFELGDLDSYLGDGAVVDLDQVTRGRVDLETLVEGECGFNGLGSYSLY